MTDQPNMLFPYAKMAAPKSLEPNQPIYAQTTAPKRMDSSKFETWA